MSAAGAGGTRAAGSAGRGPRKRLPHVARGGRRCCRRALAAVVVALALAGAGCQRAPATLAPEVVARYPHDPEAFTQGLLFHDGRLFE